MTNSTITAYAFKISSTATIAHKTNMPSNCKIPKRLQRILLPLHTKNTHPSTRNKKQKESHFISFVIPIMYFLLFMCLCIFCTVILYAVLMFVVLFSSVFFYFMFFSRILRLLIALACPCAAAFDHHSLACAMSFSTP